MMNISQLSETMLLRKQDPLTAALHTHKNAEKLFRKIQQLDRVVISEATELFILLLFTGHQNHHHIIKNITAHQETNYFPKKQ